MEPEPAPEPEAPEGGAGLPGAPRVPGECPASLGRRSKGGIALELPKSAAEVVTGGNLAHVATIDEDGKPHVTLAWTGLEEGRIVFATLPDQRKLKNIRRDPRVAVSYETDKMTEMGLREYLVVYGRAEVTEGGAPELLQRLARVYIGPHVKFPPMPDPPPGYVTRITPERLRGIGPWAT